MMRIRDRACCRAKASKNTKHIAFYKSCRNLVTESIRREKKAYFTWNINKNIKNGKLCWTNIKKTVTGQQTIKLPPHLNNPDLLNKKLLEVPGSIPLDPRLLQSYKTRKQSANVFNFLSTTEQEVLRLIYSIKLNSEGLDGINIQILKLTLMMQSLASLT